MEKKRSLGIAVIMIADVLFGASLIIWGLSGILITLMDKAYIGTLCCLPNLLIGLGFLQAAKLIYKLDPKAIKGNSFISIVGIFFICILFLAMRNWTGGGLIDIVSNFGLYSFIALILFVYFVWSIVYLTRPTVKKQFN